MNNVPHPFYALLITALPEVWLILCAGLILLFGAHKRLDRLAPLGGFANLLAVAGNLAALLPIGFFYFILSREGGGKFIEHPGIHLDPTVLMVKGTLVLLSASSILLLREEQAVSGPSLSLEHKAEYPALMLFATTGLLLLVSATNLLVAFLALELSSLALYLLVALKKESPQEAKTALETFLFGGIASAFLLFGLSLLYGISGSMELRKISLSLGKIGSDPLLVTALTLIVCGLCSKLSIVPFHLWTSRTSKKSPAPTIAFISSASTLAIFFFLTILLTTGLGSAAGNSSSDTLKPGWKALLALLSLVSMIYGSFAALTQRQLRPLLGYAGMVQMGYLLMGLAVGDSMGLGAFIYYALFYAFTFLGIFGVLAVAARFKEEDELAALQTLSKGYPFLGVGMAILLASWIGIAPLAGFFSKFYLFSAVLRDSSHGLFQSVLVGIAFLTTGISLYYFLPILRALFVRKPNVVFREDALPKPFQSTFWLMGLVLLLVILGGCFPQFFINLLSPR